MSLLLLLQQAEAATVALDAITRDPDPGTANGIQNPFTHTPVGTPKGVILIVVNSNQNTVWDTGATYGGQPMTEIQAQQQNAGSEFGGVHIFFLGSGIPTGPQTVNCQTTGSPVSQYSVCITLTSDAATTAVVDSDGLTATSGANPSLSLSTDRDTFVAGGLWSGQDAITGITEGAGQTSIKEEDFGADVAGTSYMTSIQSAGSITYGWTMATEEHAIAAIAVGAGASGISVGQATETDTASRLATVIGQASETDEAQAITLVEGLVVEVGQATETDLAQGITILVPFGQASELDRAKQIGVIGGLVVPADTPVVIRAPRKAGRIFHEIEGGGDTYHPSIGEWSAEEDAPGGFRGAKGQISRRVFDAHRDVFQAGATWRTFLDDGHCIFAGKLKEPDSGSSVVELSADGRAVIADKIIGPVLYQTAVGSELSHFANDSKRWTVEFTTMSHNFVDSGILFQRKSDQDSGNANVIIPFFGREVAFLRMHMQGTDGFLSVKTTQRVQIPSSNRSAELDLDGVIYENFYFNFPTTQVAENVAIDLTAGAEVLPSPNQSVFTNVGTPSDTGVGFFYPHLIIFEVADWGSTPSDSEAEILLSNIEVNGSAMGDARYYNVGDLVEDIAARLGFREFRTGGAGGVLPYEIPPGGTAAEALDWCSLMSGNLRWRILDNGAQATFEFDYWGTHTWALASPWSPLRTIPEARYDAVAVPFQYPGTHGQLTDHVVVRVDDSPFISKKVNWSVNIPEPAHNKDRAIGLGHQIAEELVRPRFSGDFAAAEIYGPDGEKLSAHHMNAGDILAPWRRDEPGRLRIGRLTRFEDHVEGEFDGEERALAKLLARRSKRIERRG